MILSAVLGVSLFASLSVAVAIILTQRFHGHLTHDSHDGVQKLHKSPTPRVGGLALLAGACAGGLLLPEESRSLWWGMALCALPAFACGLLEDITKRTGVRLRFLATICAGLIFCLLTGQHIARVDIVGLDRIFAVTPFAVLFTAVAIGGIANAINLIDGVNGLASGTSIIILSGFAILAAEVGDRQILGISLILAGALGGFFLTNFPMGRIFLGDAGAYATGFMLAALAVALPARNPEITPLVGLLALSYPVTETLVSIHRRLVRAGTSPGQPDRLHLHSLIYRSRARRLAARLGVPKMRNAMSGMVVMTLPLGSTALMLLCATSPILTLLSIMLVSTVYLILYRKVALLGPFGLGPRPATVPEI